MSLKQAIEAAKTIRDQSTGGLIPSRQWSNAADYLRGLDVVHLALVFLEADAELSRLREALAWGLDNGVVKAVHHIDGKPHPRLVKDGDYDSVTPPEHLRCVIDAALIQGKP